MILVIVDVHSKYIDAHVVTSATTASRLLKLSQTLKAGLKKTPGPDLETRVYRILSRYRVTPQTTIGQTPAGMLMMRRPRFRLDLVYPALDNRALDKQTAAWEHHGVALSPREF